VPLFVEELTKMVLESDLLQEQEDRYELTGPLPPFWGRFLKNDGSTSSKR
jgi:hypothetical protein